MQLYNNVFRWWFLCALDQDCIAPTTDVRCQFVGRDQFGDCHRYDQSALNILLANYFIADPLSYVARPSAGPLLTVERRSRGKERLAVCDAGRPVRRVKSSSFI